MIWFVPKFNYDFEIGFFADRNDYLDGKLEVVKRSVNDKKIKLWSADSIGMRKFKIQVPLITAMKYNTKYLKFVHDVKNDLVKNKKYYIKH